MKPAIAIAIAILAAFVAGAGAVIGAALLVGASLLPSAGQAFGGAFDPISAGLAVGLGGLALRQLRARLGAEA